MEEQNNKILLAIDFEKQSLIALEYTVYFARKSKADIVILHVIEEGNFVSKMFSSDDESEKMREGAQELLKDITDKLSDEFNVTSIIETGKAYEKIIEVAKEIMPRFILMGVSEVSGIKRRFVGSNTWHVLEDSPFPVITIRGDQYITDEEKERDIVLPLDLTKNVSEQVAVAVVFAKYFNSRVRILSIVTSQSIALELTLLRRLNRAKKKILDAGVECTATLKKDSKTPVHDAVIEFAREEDSHLIVIMTQEEAHFMEHFIGSIAKGFIEKSDIPVLSVNPWKYESDGSIMNIFVDPLGIYNKSLNNKK